MMTRAGTVPLSDLQFLKIYFNRRRLRSTTANLKKMLAEAGGDAICNGSIFLRNQQPACHLKADGKVYKAPNYRAWAISWNTPADFGVKTVPNSDANYMECVHLIIDGKKISPIHCGADMKYKAPRTAIGTKGGRFAYYVSRDRRTPEQLRDLLAASGWDNAIMMDGGGSTCFMDPTGKGFTGDGRVIPFFLVWKLKSGDACEPEGEKPMVEINAYSKAKDGSKKLSTHFKVKEFACGDGSDAVLVAPRLVMVLQSIRRRGCDHQQWVSDATVQHQGRRRGPQPALLRHGGGYHREGPDAGDGGGLRKRADAGLGRRGRIQSEGLHTHRRAGSPGRLERIRRAMYGRLLR